MAFQYTENVLDYDCRFPNTVVYEFTDQNHSLLLVLFPLRHAHLMPMCTGKGKLIPQFSRP